MGLLKETYADLYGERFDTNPAYTKYDCMAEGTLHISLMARTLSEAEDAALSLPAGYATIETPEALPSLSWQRPLA